MGANMKLLPILIVDNPGKEWAQNSLVAGERQLLPFLFDATQKRHHRSGFAHSYLALTHVPRSVEKGAFLWSSKHNQGIENDTIDLHLSESSMSRF